MPYISDGRIMIQDAFKRHYTLPAFNICSAEMIRACIEAAEEEKAPIILQTYPADSLQISTKHIKNLIKSYAEDATVPIMLHMDHGQSLQMDIDCIRNGYSSVMYDGANQDLSEVIATTKQLVSITSVASVAVEVAAESFNAGQVEYTKPEDALKLKEAGADMIAVSIGTEHGQTGALKLDLLKDIYETLNHPLVIHGGSGVSAEDYAAARTFGVVKANIGSALYRALRKVWESSADAKNHREVYERARAALKEVAREKIRFMGAEGKA
ncbi:MAG: class II fructose-bisphosphate aldolase [Trueperaceae bacterium]|nr:class II fructose-bisphosphate aldolase [Trueperaceae bacterium]